MEISGFGFYLNWALHTRIDREPWAKEGLHRLEEVVSGFNSGTHDAEAVLRGVTGLLSFQRLHAEFLGFGAESNIRFDQLSNEEWRQFSTLLIDVLVDCPIVSELDTTTVKALSLSRDFTFSHAGGQNVGILEDLSWSGESDGRTDFLTSLIGDVTGLYGNLETVGLSNVTALRLFRFAQ
jgi:hypothetical protein